MSISEEHREIAAGFSERVAGTTDWDAPTPVDDWVARDVVRHLVTWLPGFLHSSGLPALPGGPSVEADPVGAWRAHANGVQGLLDGPDADIVFDHVHIGTMRLDEAINMIYTADVFLHTWDLARATGQDDRLDPDRCAAMLAGMEQMEDAIRNSGQYGPRFDVPDDADVQDRLIGFIGRDPGWRPPV